MARPRSFDEGEVVQKAMMAFWRHGYEGTSITDLEAATGVSRISLYNAFGDKEGLFRSALQAYTDMALGALAHALSGGRVDDLLAFFDAIGEAQPQESPRNLGCLMVNTVTEVTHIGEETKAIIRAYREALITQFETCLSNLQAAGAVTSAIDARDSAEYLVGSLWGMLSTVRLYMDATKARPLAKATTVMIRAWRMETA